MAGCRPEYMPVLVALIEAMADHCLRRRAQRQHAGRRDADHPERADHQAARLQLHAGRDARRLLANTSIGRFWRLYLRNVAGFLPHKNDKATFGNTWRVVVAENEDVVKKIGWEPNSVDFGFAAGDNTVTISRYTGGNHISSVSGSTPRADDALPRATRW